MVYRLAARMLGPGAEAEDACQEVFMRAHRSFDSYDPARPLAPWLGRISYHVCLRRLGNAQREGVATEPERMARVEDEREPSPERVAASRQTGRLVLDAMEQLSAQDRALVTLRYVDELTDLEVSEVVGMNRNTVRTRLHRARMVLMRALAPVLGGRS
jgi:RNA polymerase sigma-70 factor (ECF subfamily)